MKRCVYAFGKGLSRRVRRSAERRGVAQRSMQIDACLLPVALRGSFGNAAPQFPQMKIRRRSGGRRSARGPARCGELVERLAETGQCLAIGRVDDVPAHRGGKQPARAASEGGGGVTYASNQLIANQVTASLATIGGGWGNLASGEQSTVPGGGVNTTSGTNSTMGVGPQNTASGPQSTVPGGLGNVASGQESFAGH